MTKIAIYPGTFDPITFGHVDLITKGLKVVDKIIVAISDAINKECLFSVDERMLLIKNALYKDLKFNKNKVDIISFNSLTTALCKKYKANLILRGLRAVSDFEYEFQLAGMNKRLNTNIETIFLMANIENQVIGRAQRVGRTQPLHIHYLYHQNVNEHEFSQILHLRTIHSDHWRLCLENFEY